MNPQTPARGLGERPTPASVDPTFWRDRSVLLTGHTGFKGAWLSLWLQSLGAHVTGVSLAAPVSNPSLYQLARVDEGMADSISLDIRDASLLARAVTGAHPEVVIHMAAQPLVRRSYASPLSTYETNVIGTANLLDAVRACSGVRAVVVVTSDKCYEHRDSSRPFREDDPLGGHDPYSSSKAAAELVTSAYRHSFFSDPDGPRIATARAGNVIGGGDWGEDRLLPDIVRAVTGDEELRLRNPHAVRPWQHVLSPLSGYLMLAQALCESVDHACPFNFGPHPSDARSVESIVRRVSELWPGALRFTADAGPHPHEAPSLELDSTQARTRLGWAPLLGLDDALAATVVWYRAWLDGEDLRELTLGQVIALG